MKRSDVIRALLSASNKATPWPKNKPFPFPFVKKVKLNQDQKSVLEEFLDGDEVKSLWYGRGDYGNAQVKQLVKKGLLEVADEHGKQTLYETTEEGLEALGLGTSYVEEDNYVDPETGVVVRVFGDGVTNENPRVAVLNNSKILFSKEYDTTREISGDGRDYDDIARKFLERFRGEIKLPKARAAWRLDSEHSARGMTVKVYRHPKKKEVQVVVTSPAYPKPTKTLLKPNDPMLRNTGSKPLAEVLWNRYV